MHIDPDCYGNYPVPKMVRPEWLRKTLGVIVGLIFLGGLGFAAKFYYDLFK